MSSPPLEANANAFVAVLVRIGFELIEFDRHVHLLTLAVAKRLERADVGALEDFKNAPDATSQMKSSLLSIGRACNGRKSTFLRQVRRKQLTVERGPFA
jgi:hypothetical protein